MKLFAVVLCALSLSACCSSELRGRVLEESGATPLEGAEVSIWAYESGYKADQPPETQPPPDFALRTDAEGRFRVELRCRGTAPYRLRVRAEGYAAVQDNIVTDSGGGERREYKLARAP